MFDFFRTKKAPATACFVATECEHATRPRGAHCNFQGMLLLPFQPELLATDIYYVKDFLISNPGGVNLTKRTTVFPKNWSPVECAHKVLEAIKSENKKVMRINRFGLVKIVAYTQENIEIIAFCDTKKSNLALFFPNFQEEVL